MTTTTRSNRVLTLKINDKDIAAPEGQSILDVAAANGIDIPTLCHLDGLKDVASCRLCLVEIKGSSRLFPACATLCREGMQVFTETDALREHRKMLVEMLLAEGNHVCAVCAMNGHCELQRLAQRLGVDHVELEYRYPVKQVDASHPRFVFDPNRCTLCTRCLRACEQIEGAHNWDVMGRGINARLVAGLNRPWALSDICTSCGKCVLVCPTGALYEKGLTACEQERRRENRPFLAMAVTK